MKPSKESAQPEGANIYWLDSDDITLLYRTVS